MRSLFSIQPVRELRFFRTACTGELRPRPVPASASCCFLTALRKEIAGGGSGRDPPPATVLMCMEGGRATLLHAPKPRPRATSMPGGGVVPPPPDTGAAAAGEDNKQQNLLWGL